MATSRQSKNCSVITRQCCAVLNDRVPSNHESTCTALSWRYQKLMGHSTEAMGLLKTLQTFVTVKICWAYQNELLAPRIECRTVGHQLYRTEHR